MKVIEILGDNREGRYTKIIEGCRGVLIKEGKILLSYYKDLNRYLIPGGGLENGESLCQCCERELSEETGCIVCAGNHYLTLEEYYHEYYFKSHYFICEYIGECESSLTENEKKTGLEAIWVDLDEALRIFASYPNYKDTDEIQFGAYYREYTALSELLKCK